ncbi:MAG: exo-alpha-sialidase [Balneolia bacterium]|nr:exo-alpha-sialidase [Balneolia bacterium]
MLRFLKACALLLLIFLCSCTAENQDQTSDSTETDTPSLSIYELDNPAGPGSRYPSLFTDNSGAIHMSWTTVENDSVRTIASVFKDGEWSDSQVFSKGATAAYFVNWADFPSVVGRNGAPLAAHHLKKVDGGTFAYHVEVSFYNPDSSGWNSSFRAHKDDSPTEHGFVSMAALRDDAVLAIWLDGRYTEGAHGNPDFSHSMTLRSAELHANGSITRKQEIDNTVCDCCQTDLIPVSDGYLAIYRNREEGEIRDIFFSRYSLATGEWSEPQPLHRDGWVIFGCPVNGPRGASSDSTVAIVWFTEAEGKPEIKLAISQDDGRSFDSPIVLETEKPAGRTDVLFADDGRLFVSWLDMSDGNGYIMLQEFDSAGNHVSDVIKLQQAEYSPRGGFPRMAVLQDSILLAWTQTQPEMQVRTALIEIDISS